MSGRQPRWASRRRHARWLVHVGAGALNGELEDAGLRTIDQRTRLSALDRGRLSRRPSPCSLACGAARDFGRIAERNHRRDAPACADKGEDVSKKETHRLSYDGMRNQDNIQERSESAPQRSRQALLQRLKTYTAYRLECSVRNRRPYHARPKTSECFMGEQRRSLGAVAIDVFGSA